MTIADLSPESKALLVEIMRERRRKAEAEIAKLQQEVRDLDAWLAEHDPEADR